MKKTPILKRLCVAKVFEVAQNKDGTFMFWECDCYYHINLTRDEVLKLADELRELVK